MAPTLCPLPVLFLRGILHPSSQLRHVSLKLVSTPSKGRCTASTPPVPHYPHQSQDFLHSYGHCGALCDHHFQIHNSANRTDWESWDPPILADKDIFQTLRSQSQKVNESYMELYVNIHWQRFRSVTIWPDDWKVCSTASHEVTESIQAEPNLHLLPCHVLLPKVMARCQQFGLWSGNQVQKTKRPAALTKHVSLWKSKSIATDHADLLWPVGQENADLLCPRWNRGETPSNSLAAGATEVPHVTMWHREAFKPSEGKASGNISLAIEAESPMGTSGKPNVDGVWVGLGWFSFVFASSCSFNNGPTDPD